MKGLILRLLRFVIPAILLVSRSHAVDQKRPTNCPLVFETESLSVLETSEWWMLETQFNSPTYTKPQTLLVIEKVLVDSKDVIIEVLKGYEEFAEKLKEGEKVKWFRHPWNKNTNVPFYFESSNSSSLISSTSSSQEYVSVALTASRSTVFLGDNLAGTSIKMGVDHPHGPLGPKSASKAKTSDDVRSALPHSQIIQNIDQLHSSAPLSFIVLKDIAVVRPVGSLEGQIYRDLSPLVKHNRYFPAVSIPHLGRQIAQRNGVEFDEFWRMHYIEKLGEVKAEFLHRYGFLFEDPHPQNFMIELDSKWRPTGRLVIRDLADIIAYVPRALQLGLEDDLKQELQRQVPPTRQLFLRSSNSVFSFRNQDGGFLDQKTQIQWETSHKQKFFEVFSKLMVRPELNMNGSGRSDRFDLFDQLLTPQ